MLKKNYLEMEKELKKKLKFAEIYETICIIVMFVAILIGLMLFNTEGIMAIGFAVFCAADAVKDTTSIRTEITNLQRWTTIEDED